MAKRLIEYKPNYEPFPKQMLLHNAPTSYNELIVILYGGQRRAGKSAGILADAVMFAMTYPGAKICILRESIDAVKQSFLDKLPTLFPPTFEGETVYTYKEKSGNMDAPLSRSVVFPNGSYITFQRVANYAEAIDKQGYEFHYLAIDELTKQEERTFDYLLTAVSSAKIRNAVTGKELRIPTKVVCGCNPGGIGHKWVKRRFIDTTVTKYSDDGHNTPLETKDYFELTTVPDRDHPGKTKEIKTTVRFIPASWKDNIHINDSYVAILDKLPEHKKEMDMYGNWEIVAGRLFDFGPESYIDKWTAMEMIRKYDPDIYISIDWGYKPSYHSAGWYAVFSDHRAIRFKELYGQELIFEDFVKEIKTMSKDYHIVGTCLPHDMFRHGDRYKDDNGRIIGEMKSDVFTYHGLNPMGIESGKGKVDMRFDKIHSASRLNLEDGNRRIQITSDCEALKQELDTAITDEINPTRMAKGTLDHAIDEFGLFLVMYSQDIAPISIEDIETKDERPKMVRKLDEDYKLALRRAEDTVGYGQVDDDITISLEEDYDFV